MIDTKGKFYLGRIHDPQTAKTGDTPLLYDPADLTTHAVVVGMTGSGKTGLCLGLLEEAALNHIPALMIDPKGDITNALLHFPELLPTDFQPWINADQARREGKTVEQAAEETAVLWRSGLGQWDIQPERLQALKESVRFTIYTPGSDAGLPISILASLKAPTIPWNDNKELLREQISGTVTALLGLVGLKDIDPVRSREHILLANIFETAWSQGQDLDLGELIMQTQSPPFEKLGVFDINRFFPEKERFDLAMRLNNIMAAPAFQAWIEGEPLDIARLLYEPDGRARHTIFYIAHLPEAERMFFITLLYSAVESWMRAQSGTTSLRALVYFDEIFGYLPPVGNPPSKEPMLRMLKQARAFGVGLVLATQNPVDVDYKALSNAGTWFIGKLGTDQDKQRLLDGLASATPGGLDRRTYDNLISAIGKRVFLMRNVHGKQPLLFQTRWAMNYLAGPVTRTQIPALNKLAGAPEPLTGDSSQLHVSQAQSSDASAQTPLPTPQPSAPSSGTATRPAVPARVVEYFLPNNLTVSQAAARDGRSLPPSAQPIGLLYRPALLAQADVRFLNRKYNLDTDSKRAALVLATDDRGVVRWQEHETPPLDGRALDPQPAPQARFAELPRALQDARTIAALNTDFVDWVYRNAQVTVRANETLKVYAGPEVSEAQFARLCVDAADALLDAELDKVEAIYEKKAEAIKVKLAREERELREDEAELSQRKQEEMATHAETFMSLFSRRKRSVSTSLTKRRMTEKAKAEVEESVEAIQSFNKEIDSLTKEMGAALDDVKRKWANVAANVSEIKVTPLKKDVVPELFGVAWMPYHLLQTADGGLLELPGFKLA
ncbi:MAG: DUF87 domain-containing protein [Chloroflexi bacterium]|nr:DUF87 domain-containing protein [Chloroflexota bacterium]